MRGEPVSTDQLKSQHSYYTTLKAHVITNLPAAYGRYNCTTDVKSFSIRITGVDDDCFAATAVANLGPPVFLVRSVDVVLEDDFMKMYSDVSALEALELLFDQLEMMIEGGERDSCGEESVGSTYTLW